MIKIWFLCVFISLLFSYEISYWILQLAFKNMKPLQIRQSVYSSKLITWIIFKWLSWTFSFLVCFFLKGFFLSMVFLLNAFVMDEKYDTIYTGRDVSYTRNVRDNLKEILCVCIDVMFVKILLMFISLLKMMSCKIVHMQSLNSK